MAKIKCVLDLKEHRRKIIAAQMGTSSSFESKDSNSKHKRTTKVLHRALRVTTYGIYVGAMQAVS
jgi:hypothetical protein